MAERSALRDEMTDIDTLTRWSDTSVPVYDVVAENPNVKERLFPVDRTINKKIVLWNGDVTQLNAEAIVNSTNESLNDRNLVSERILAKAGPRLRKELRTLIKSCKTGEAKMTRGYNLPSRYVLHTVGPRYNLRYKTAAENALFSSYRSILQVLRENHMTSVGLSCVHTQRRGYPAYEGAHIALRTVRRFMEKYGEDIEAVVFVATGGDEVVYQSLLPLYFPRNSDEELFAAMHLPLDVGNVDGEPVIAERQIRITAKPTLTPAGNDLEESVNINEAFETSVAIGAHAFSKMQGDVDKARQKKMQRLKGTSEDLLDQQKRYDRMLRKAKQVDLSEIEAIHCLYHSGFDKAGRAVIVFIAHYFEAHLVDLDKALLFFVDLMEPIVRKKFVIVYMHTMTSKEQQPTVSFLKHIDSIIDSRYRNNLSAIYIIHPTFWSKVLMWYFSTFCASGMKGKVQYIPGLEYLYSRVPIDQLDLPQFVVDYDQRVKGTRYYDPDEDEALGSL